MSNIEGPYSFKGADGLKTPLYIFLPGGERKDIGVVTVKVDGGMDFTVAMDPEHKDVKTASFDVPMRYTYLNRPNTPVMEWGYNCLTSGIHHGRPEAIWDLPLQYGITMFEFDGLKKIVVARIYNDAKQFVDHAPTDHNITTPEWAIRVRDLAEEQFEDFYNRKLTEILEYYSSAGWTTTAHGIISQIQTNTLNVHYNPRHAHDSINMLCRILGTSCSREATA